MNNETPATDLSDTFSIYATDIPLFKRLGLTPFIGVKRGEPVECGTALIWAGRAEIKVTAHGLPAVYWHLEIKDTEGHRYQVHTGTGSLTYFMPALELIANNSLVVIPVGDDCVSTNEEALAKAVRRMAFEPFGSAEASDREVLDAITAFARETLVKAGGGA